MDHKDNQVAFLKGKGSEIMSCDPTDLFLPPSTGLRTLCFAVADISESSYQQWLELHHRASTSLQNRSLKLEESYELIEKVCYTTLAIQHWNKQDSMINAQVYVKFTLTTCSVPCNYHKSCIRLFIRECSQPGKWYSELFIYLAACCLCIISMISHIASGVIV